MLDDGTVLFSILNASSCVPKYVQESAVGHQLLVHLNTMQKCSNSTYGVSSHGSDYEKGRSVGGMGA